VYDPALSRVLDEERVERDEQFGERERVPAPSDLDLDLGFDFVSLDRRSAGDRHDAPSV
jgi:hypothetical protein